MSTRRHPHNLSPLALVLLAACVTPACSAAAPPAERQQGQSDFISAPLAGNAGSGGRSLAGGEMAPTAADKSNAQGATTGRQVEETDLYRLEGNRLYYLNGYRGLMVFDVSAIDQPKFLGRAPIFGSPVEMIVRNGIASVVVADWYGKDSTGRPFHGSVVRRFDATDPSNIKESGEVQLGGWVRDTRIVGDVLYAVSETQNWSYGWYGYGGDIAVGVATRGGSSGTKVQVTSVNIAGAVPVQKGTYEVPGYGGIFNVTANAIMVASQVMADKTTWSQPTGNTLLQYIDITDPEGAIKLRGATEVTGVMQGWGADNGRWNLDFADGTTAHTLGCIASTYGYCNNEGFVLTTTSFKEPDAPSKVATLPIASPGWSATARFVPGRLYLAPDSGWSPIGGQTPVQIYDLSDEAAPKMAGASAINGSVSLFMPSNDRLFALGNEWASATYDSSQLALRYLDVADASKPAVLGVANFGKGWAWTPAANTFKAFIKNDQEGLVALPFSGWDYNTYKQYNGVQLIEFSRDAIRTAGVANTKGWVERGIFVKGRLVSLSDTTLTVVDYSDHNQPREVASLTLARNVVDALPHGASKTVTQVSTSWWDQDTNSSELRVLPLTDPEERTTLSALANATVDGTNARVYRNGDLAYVVTDVRLPITCPPGKGIDGVPTDPGKGGSTSTPQCFAWTQQVQVVDLVGGTATLRGKVQLPVLNDYSWGGWGWGGCYWYDWYNGAGEVQVQGNAIAFRRWLPNYSATSYDESRMALFVVDLADANAPKVASTTITQDPQAWWGNMRAVGSTLYTSHTEWITRPDFSTGSVNGVQYTVRYYLDQIDLTDRAHPKVGARINVPGLLVGASATDPSIVYTIDYRYYGNSARNDLCVLKLEGDRAYLQSSIGLDGWVGNVLVRGTKAYTTTQRYDSTGNTGPTLNLHEIDLTDPKNPQDRVASDDKGWGWLLGVEGDRAIVTSGWGNAGVDIYRLQEGKAPAFDQFVRTRGWWTNALSRLDQQLFLSSGYWGVQAVTLAQ